MATRAVTLARTRRGRGTGPRPPRCIPSKLTVVRPSRRAVGLAATTGHTARPTGDDVVSIRGIGRAVRARLQEGKVRRGTVHQTQTDHSQQQSWPGCCRRRQHATAGRRRPSCAGSPGTYGSGHCPSSVEDRDGDGNKDTDNEDDDHELDEGETLFLLEHLHRCSPLSQGPCGPFCPLTPIIGVYKQDFSVEFARWSMPVHPNRPAVVPSSSFRFTCQRHVRPPQPGRAHDALGYAARRYLMSVITWNIGM